MTWNQVRLDPLLDRVITMGSSGPTEAGGGGREIRFLCLNADLGFSGFTYWVVKVPKSGVLFIFRSFFSILGMKLRARQTLDHTGAPL